MLQQLKLLSQPGIIFKVVLILVVVVANVVVVRRAFHNALNSQTLRNTLQIIAFYIPTEIKEKSLFED